MTNILDGLLARIDDSRLRADLAAEVAKLRDTKDFGLVFERHLPETARLLNHPRRRGARVERRREFQGPAGVVQRLKDGEATVRWEDGETTAEPAEDLVVVREFGDPVYPGLRPLGRIDCGGDKPAHVVLNAENYHALEILQYTHRGAVDVIYIDPPYNTGKKAEWRYNDRWVSGEDRFRHSKWLSFMDRRLRLAQAVLRHDGLLLISIDDNEYHHLRALCDDIFGESRWMATFIWRTEGNIDNQAKVKTNHEYILCLSPSPVTFQPSSTIDPNVIENSKLYTHEIRNSVVKNGPKNPVSEVLIPAGFPTSFHEGTIPARDSKWPKFDTDIQVANGVTITPVKVRSGWANLSMLKAFIENNFRPILDRKGQETTFELTPTGTIQNVKQRSEGQSHILTVLYNMGTTELTSNELKRMGVSFTYPKPLPLLRYLIGLHHNPDALVLDFFAGSGSTAQAVMELNASDGGSRQCILVTNNEVDDSKAKSLAKRGVHTGDDEWEEHGVFESVTRPRLETLVTGKRPDGSTYSEGLEENVEFFELAYLDPDTVSRGKAFEAVSPLLWLAAGAQGPRVDSDEPAFAVPDGGRYGVLFSTGRYKKFAAALNERPDVTHAFIITNSSAQFRQAASELPAHVEASMLYEDYLRNFEMHTGGRR